MTQVISENINNVFRYRDRIFSIITIGFIISSFLYVFFLQSAISNVVERDRISKENRSLATTVGELEAKYFTLKNSIDMELAYSKGFKDSKVTAFIPNSPVTAMVNKNEF